MKKKLISIITPTYNHSGFIAQCIESVINQTYENWEMIIVDHGSTDTTAEIILKYAKKDKRIKFIRRKKNLGISRLVNIYNQAFKKSGGKYIAILEGDDFWPKDKLKKQIRSFNNNNVVLSFGNCIMTDEKSVPIKLFTYRNYKSKPLNNQPVGSILRLFANLRFSIIPVTVMIKRVALESIGGFINDKYYPFVDIPTFLKLSLIGEFKFQNEILGYYRKQHRSEWFYFASKTKNMGKTELVNCYKHFFNKNKRNASVRGLINDKDLSLTQSNYLKTRKYTKIISIFLNNLAFKISPNPLFFVYIYQYVQYIIYKKYENRN